MSGALEYTVAAAIAVAALAGIARLWLRRGAASVETRGPLWRAAALTILQAAAAAAFVLTLFPPSVHALRGALVVATADAPSVIAVRPGERLIALPEAGRTLGAERAPDLATALRRHPGGRSIRIVGRGLAPRDRDVTGLAVSFKPPAPPPGFVDISSIEPVSAGARFTIAGRIGALSSGTVELVDPAGVVAAQTRVQAGEGFALSGVARAPGLALFDLRLKDQAGRIVERVDAPVDAAPRPRPRVLLLAGAPNPEVKFLRRWAEDAGLALSVEIEAGGGVRLTGRGTPLTAAALRDIDLVVIDDRSFEALGASEAAALVGAVEGGLGLLLRATAAPAPPVRRAWAELGLALRDQPGQAALRLDQGVTPAGAPRPTRLPIAPLGAVTLLDAEDGAVAGAWIARGEGRIGVLTAPDTWVLQTGGRKDAYGALWSRLFTTLARPDAPAPRAPGFARAGERAAVCGLSGGASVLEADGKPTALVIDPASGPEGCAAYWPATAGWRVIRSGGKETALYVHPEGAAPSLAAADASAATLTLVSTQKLGQDETTAPGSPWPWFALLLALLTALWTLERLQLRESKRNPSGGPRARPPNLRAGSAW